MCFSGLPVCPAAAVCLSSVLPTRGTLHYVGDQNTVVRAIQSEWIFIQRFTLDTRDALAGAERMIWGIFLPRLFFKKKKTLSPIVGSLSTMLVKKSVLGLLNQVAPAQEKYLSSQRGSAELIQAVMGGGAFSNANHIGTLGEERRDKRKTENPRTKPNSRV